MGTIFDLNRLSAAIDRANSQPQQTELQRETQAMYDALGSDSEDYSYTSLAAAGATELVKSLQPVSLTNDELVAYEGFFYSRRPAKKKKDDEDDSEDTDVYGNETAFSVVRRSRTFMVDAFDQIADVTNALNVFSNFMRDVLHNGRRLFTEEGTPAWAASIQNMAANALNYRDALREGEKSSVAESMYKLINATMQGDKHSLRNSQVYAGGIDVVLARSARDSALMCSDIAYGNWLESSTTDQAYADNRMQSYMTETSIKVKQAAKEILEFLFGAGTEHASFEPQLRLLPLSTDFTECQRIFEKVVGVKLPGQFFNNVTFTAGAGANYADRFCRIALVLHAEKDAAAALSASFRKEAKSLSVGPENLLSAETRIKHQVNQDVTAEAALLNRVYGSTVAFTFDKDTARYITQTEVQEELNLSSFDNWFSIWSSQFLRKPGARVTNSISQGRIKLSNIPRYVLPVSKLDQITKAREQIGMTTEKTRANADGLYVTPKGTLAYLPTQEERAKLTSITEFERLGAAVGKVCAEYGINTSLLSDPYEKLVQYGIPYDTYKAALSDLKKLVAFEGSVLSYDWDYGLHVYASARPGIVKCDVQIGAVAPDTLTIADYLGYNMAREGEPALEKSFADSMMLMTDEDPVSNKKTPKEIYGGPGDPTLWINTSHYQNIFQTYFYHAYAKELPSLQEMCDRAMTDLNLDFKAAEVPRMQYSAVYSGLIENTGRVKNAGQTIERDIEVLVKLLERTATACSGANGSWVARDVQSELGANPDYYQMQEGIQAHEDYFVPSESPAHHFARLFNFVGGNILKQMLDGINSLTVEQLTNGERTREYESNANWARPDEQPILIKHTATRPDSSVLLNFVKPISILFGKYAQNFEEFAVEAEDAIKSIERDPGVDLSDIHFAGSNEKFSVFPHQLDTHRYLRKPQPPKFAVLDISPGGGKTSIGLGDMACIVNDMIAVGKKVRPLALAPDGLVRNWCDDMKTFAGDKWNMIPIDNAVFKRWGADRLRELIENAPPNTIVVAGLNFLRNNKMSIVIGNAVINVGTNLEFIKAFKFNYIIIDESHKLKGSETTKHKMTKQLTTSSFVEYLRIATGTLIADRVRDIEGQTKLYSPHIFRSGELDPDNDDEVELDGDKVKLWKVNTPQKARQRLSRFAAVITKKKKEWAFMLPNPIETFHAVDFLPGADASVEDMKFGELHRELYDLVVQESVEALEELLAKAKKKAKSSKSGGEDDEGEDDDDPEEKEGELRLADLELGENDELALLNPLEVDAYLQRIEQLIIAPEHDKLFEKVFGAYGKKKYVSEKAKVIVDIVDRHFNPPEWNKGQNYKEFTLVSENGDLYLSRKKDLSSARSSMMPRDTIGKRPSQNNDLWKKEPEGKVIIFCRYTKSVQAVFDALPPKYQGMAVRFTGVEVDKWSNLDAFKSDPKVKILIANEMGLSEGHNLQMASRMIRVESPWGPGELDQSASRIFRPDPAGAAAGEIYREAVFLDWVLADNTMEVAKQARLIAKIFNKARFDEAENPRYEDVLRDFDLPEVSMSIEGTLQQRPSLKDFDDYVQGYAALNGIQRAEFHEMRVSMPSSMLPVEQTPEVPGSRRILTPFVSSQNIPDPNGWKPVSLKQFLRSDDGKPFAADPDRLVGQPVITDLGYGMIVSTNKRYLVNKKDGRLNEERPVSSVMVKLKDGTMTSINDLGLAFLPTKASAKDIKNEFAVDLTYRKSDIARQLRAQRDREKLDEQEAAKAAAATEKEGKAARVRERSREAGKKREQNIREGKPINTGVKYNPDMKIPTTMKPEESTTEPLVLSPAYYHGFLTLETDDLTYEKALKKLKFKTIGEYAFITVQRRNQANAVMDYIEENFHMSDQTAERLGAVFAAFEKGKRGLYNLELASPAELPHFFATRKQLVKDRKEARIYPFFMDDKLMLVVDVATSPIIKKHIGKAIPDAATKWQLSQGALMYFASNKADLNSKIKEIKAAGIEIASPDVLKKEVAEINFRAPKKK